MAKPMSMGNTIQGFETQTIFEQIYGTSGEILNGGGDISLAIRPSGFSDSPSSLVSTIQGEG